MKQWRWLIVGFGSIGRRHAQNLRELGQLAVSAVDPEASARRSAERSGFPVFESLDQGLASRPDIVMVCNPSAMHISTALAAARAGCHLFIEKPLSDSMDGIEMLASILQAKRLVALVGCNMRFHPGPSAIKRALESGKLGALLSARLEVGSFLPDWRPEVDYREGYSAHKALGGGCILDAIHELDVMCWFFGFPASVFGMARAGDTLGIKTEALAELLFHYPNGMIASVHLDYIQRWRQRRCEVIGNEGTAVWEGRRQTAEQFAPGTKEPERLWHDPQYDTNRMYIEEMRHFLRCLEGSEAPCADVEWAGRVTRLALLAKQASAGNQTLSVAREPAWSS